MSFNYKRTFGGVGRKLSAPILLADSQTVEVGDMIETYTTGEGVLATAAHFCLGVVTAIVDADGMPFKQGNPVAGTASGVDVRSQATGTSGTFYAIVDQSKSTIYSVTVDGTIGTTASSGLRGCHVDVNSAGTEYGEVLETTATRIEGVEANCYSHGVDPDDATRLLVSIAMQEFDTLTT